MMLFNLQDYQGSVVMPGDPEAGGAGWSGVDGRGVRIKRTGHLRFAGGQDGRRQLSRTPRPVRCRVHLNRV